MADSNKSTVTGGIVFLVCVIAVLKLSGCFSSSTAPPAGNAGDAGSFADGRTFRSVFVCADDSGRKLFEPMSQTLANVFKLQGMNGVARTINGSPNFSQFCVFDGNVMNGDINQLRDVLIRSQIDQNGEGIYLFQVTPTSIVGVAASR